MTTTIGSNTHIEGRVEGDADLDVAGSIEGSVAISQKLTVLESGFVKGDVQAAEVQIDGAFEGSLNVSGLLRLTATANVQATIETGALILEDGAALSGDITMDVAGDVPRKSASATSSTTSSTSGSSSGSSGSSGSSSSGASGTAAAQQTSSSATTTTVVEEEAEEEGGNQPTANDLTAAMMEEQTVKELREQLRERDLPVSGTKQELIDRLQEAGDD